MSLNPNTRVTLTIGAYLTVLSAIIWGTYQGTNLLRDVRDDIRGIRLTLGQISHEKVGYGDLERWTYSLERDNRGVPLRVPDLRQYQPAPASQTAGKTKDP